MTTEHRTFPDGARVQIVRDGGWPDGTAGTITVFPDFVQQGASLPPHSPQDFTADGLVRTRSTGRRTDISQWVVFDEATDDGSGDGPYSASEVSINYLHDLRDADEHNG